MRFCAFWHICWLAQARSNAPFNVLGGTVIGTKSIPTKSKRKKETDDDADEEDENPLSASLGEVEGEVETINIPKSNVLIYYLEDGTKICARPSGTEPKIKFYFSVNATLEDANDFEEANQYLDTKIQNIITEMKLN